jgi:hypothetical protein
MFGGIQEINISGIKDINDSQKTAYVDKSAISFHIHDIEKWECFPCGTAVRN